MPDATGFMNAEATFAILMAQSTFETVCPRIPVGAKTNVYCVVDNQANTVRMKEGRRRAFEDDCGAYNSSSQRRVAALYRQVPPGRFMKVYMQNGVYHRECQVDGRTIRVPYAEQPAADDVFQLVRTYFTLRADPEYRKRVSFLEQPHRFHDVFVAEYIGTWKPPVAHGNCKRPKAAVYKRTRRSVSESMSQLLRGGC